MACLGHDAADREHAFSLTLPKKIAFELRLANERAWLTTNIDEVRGDHRHGKPDRDRVPFGILPAPRLDPATAGIRFRIRRFFSLLFFVGSRSCQGDRQTKRETAGYKKQGCR